MLYVTSSYFPLLAPCSTVQILSRWCDKCSELAVISYFVWWHVLATFLFISRAPQRTSTSLIVVYWSWCRSVHVECWGTWKQHSASSCWKSSHAIRCKCWRGGRSVPRRESLPTFDGVLACNRGPLVLMLSHGSGLVIIDAVFMNSHTRYTELVRSFTKCCCAVRTINNSVSVVICWICLFVCVSWWWVRTLHLSFCAVILRELWFWVSCACVLYFTFIRYLYYRQCINVLGLWWNV